MDMADEKVLSLQRLSPAQAVRLFVKKSPRPLQASDFMHSGASMDEQLRDHPLLSFLDGHPQAISLCASLLQDKSLVELTALVTQESTALHASVMPPLITSLHVSIASLPDQDTLKCFAPQGLLPAGGLALDFKALMGPSWETAASILCRYSLLQKHFPVKFKDESMLQAWQHYGQYVTGPEKFALVNRSRHQVKWNHEDTLQTSVARATLLSTAAVYSTFPFISSFARRLLHDRPAEFESLDSPCAKHFQKSLRWMYHYIGTFAAFSNAA